jgi:hypothetical protein
MLLALTRAFPAYTDADGVLPVCTATQIWRSRLWAWPHRCEAVTLVEIGKRADMDNRIHAA